MTEQQPPNTGAYAEHPDLDEAFAEDEHGPAFGPPPDAEADDE